MSNLYEFFLLTSNFLHPGSGFGSALQPMRNHITAVNFWKTSLQGLGAHAHKLTHTHTPRTHHHTHKQDRTKGGYQFPICPPIRSHLSDWRKKSELSWFFFCASHWKPQTGTVCVCVCDRGGHKNPATFTKRGSFHLHPAKKGPPKHGPPSLPTFCA